MARFSSPAKQARSIVNELRRDKILPSIRSGQNYLERLTIIGKYAQGMGLPRLRDMTPNDCIAYFEHRRQEVKQSTLDSEKLALQYTLQLTGQLDKSEKLAPVTSELDEAKRSRFYTQEQKALVKNCQSEKHRLITELAAASGMRAHEILTILPKDEREADNRPANVEKFLGRQGEIFTTQGKGSLIREVMIPFELASSLKRYRLDEPVKVVDRGVVYWSHYDLPGGHKWSDSFSKASNRALGWSRGAHGLRHSYAQERMRELQKHGLTYNRALETVSQEMGHFRSDITMVYLR